ncbi:MAG: sensor histidine kinase [Bacteroidota bacterium]
MKDWLWWIDHKLENQWIRHLVFWLVIFFIYYTFYTFGLYESFFVFIINFLSLLPAQIMAAYLTVYVLIPKLIFHKKYFLFFLSLLLSGYVFLVLTRILTVYMVEVILERGYHQDSIIAILMDIKHLLARYLMVVYLPPALMAILSMLRSRVEEKRLFDAMRMEKTTAELNFLKAQIHPHFLFNTLNNLYALTLRKSDAAPEVVLTLSSMLDYMLYQCNDPRVPINKEIQLIENYIQLELLRYGERLDLRFDHQVDDPHSMIAPMILLSFVENAFKHGASGDILQPKVYLSLSVYQNHLSFEVFNTKTKIAQSDDRNFKQGIGQSNVQRQLDLVYSGSHRLNIEETADTYSCHLDIDL